jgi:hypothetical protein
MWWIAQAGGYGGGWWNGSGWWWWWIAFVVIFFLLPLGYGWGYRGWGPWYRRTRRPGVRPTDQAAGTTPAPEIREEGWGCLGIVLWIILIVAILWVVAAVGRW